MNSIPPDHVAAEIEAGVSRGVINAGTVRGLVKPAHYYYASALLQLNISTPMAFIKAVRIYENDHKREVVEAFLLVGAENKTFKDILLMDPDTIMFYRDLFFDMSVFDDRLDIDAYARTYREGPDGKLWGREIKTAAIDMGLEYMKVRFSHGTYEVPPAVAVRSAITQGYVMARAAQLAGIDSNVSREARGWMLTLGKNVSILPAVKEETVNKALDLRIALTQDTNNSGTPAGPSVKIDPAHIVTE